MDKINVYIYPNAIKLAGIKIPKDQDETKFSIQYTLACAFLNGSYGIDDMDPSRLTEEVRDIIEKITLISDDSMEDRKNGIRGTKVEIIKKNGDVLEETVLVPKGDPEKPLTRTDIMEKLRVCSMGQADEETLTRIIRAIEDIKGDTVFRNPMCFC